uniref:Uncharacterized protein n=1 Tax=Arundo donax TaxID=35708 RepID=A0A0A9ACR7_ARUDO
MAFFDKNINHSNWRGKQKETNRSMHLVNSSHSCEVP